ncbi:hypothetical protein JXL83_03780 [candidate division WOR-3 bacterium]|nr:hypothetical protein [candidate division WOR-3 bacterium]
MKTEVFKLAEFPGRNPAYRLMNALSAELIASSVENPEAADGIYSVYVSVKDKVKARRTLKKFISSGSL